MRNQGTDNSLLFVMMILLAIIACATWVCADHLKAISESLNKITSVLPSRPAQ